MKKKMTFLALALAATAALTLAACSTTVVGWFGYVDLSLLAVDENGQVDPAGDVSTATDGVIDELESGADAFTIIGGLEEPVTVFANACAAAGVTL